MSHWSGADVLMPAVVDYEVRRKLHHLGATAKLRNLDALRKRYDYLDISAAAWDHAAALWGALRRQGAPTASPDDLDVDCIVAGLALTLGQPCDTVTIATSNISHFGRFPGIHARVWTAIT